MGKLDKSKVMIGIGLLILVAAILVPLVRQPKPDAPQETAEEEYSRLYAEYMWLTTHPTAPDIQERCRAYNRKLERRRYPDYVGKEGFRLIYVAAMPPQRKPDE